VSRRRKSQRGGPPPQAQKPGDLPLQAKFSQGVALHRQGRLADAERIYAEVLQKLPNHFDAMHLLGVIALQTRRAQRAVELFSKAIALNPDIAEAHSNLGKGLRDLKRPEAALASFEKAIALKPDFADAYNKRGIVLRELDRSETALTSYDMAIALKPDFAEAYYNRGNVLQDLKRFEETIASFEQAIALKPDFAVAHNNLGNVQRWIERPQEALANYDKAIAIRPDFAEAYDNRGTALRDLERPDEALVSCNKAIALEQDFADAYNNRGNALRELKRPEEALASFDKAIALKPSYVEAHWNKSLCLLQMGRLEQGLEIYEWREKREKPIAACSGARPLWLGEEDIDGKTLMIHWEHGLGDTIQFCRFAKLAEARGAKVIMSVQEPLRGLMTQLSPTIEILGGHEKSPNFDFQIPLMSLPLAFATTREKIPAEIPYLRVEQERVNKWKKRLGDDGFKIGICWQGSINKIDIGRSIPLTNFYNISWVPNVRLISLQKYEGTEQLENLPEEIKIETLGADFDSGPHAFLDAAAVMESMDLIITSDTSIAHLAGALGRPTWVALKHVPDWRWMLEGESSPWYPTLRLFRQKVRGEWKPVFDDMLKELSGSPALGTQSETRDP